MPKKRSTQTSTKSRKSRKTPKSVKSRKTPKSVKSRKTPTARTTTKGHLSKNCKRFVFPHGEAIVCETEFHFP